MAVIGKHMRIYHAKASHLHDIINSTRIIFDDAGYKKKGLLCEEAPMCVC